jgi:large subunit ribosomal protein L6
MSTEIVAEYQELYKKYNSLILMNSDDDELRNNFEKKLEINGVGMKYTVSGKKVVLNVGFSHPVEVEIPDGIVAKLEENNSLHISGIDKQAVGQFAANIKDLKKVEPYKGKGFRYAGEKVRRKVGKKAGAK